MIAHIVDQAAVRHAGSWWLQAGAGAVPIRVSGAPVLAFEPGWTPTFAYTGFAPFVFLNFDLAGGEAACWILQPDGERIAGWVHELSDEDRAALSSAAKPLIARLSQTLLCDPAPTLDPAMRGFLRLPSNLRGEIGTLCAAMPPASATMSLDPGRVAACLARSYQDSLVSAAQTGVLMWPSPVDGRPLAVQGCLCADDWRFAYRLPDPAHGLVHYLIVSDDHAETAALYTPALGLAVLADGPAGRWFAPHRPGIPEWLVNVVCRYGELLEPAWRDGVAKLGSLVRGWGLHVGHQLWNELTGIDRFVRAGPFVAMPDWIVPGPGLELYGPLDTLFPSLAGHVDRSAPDVLAAVREAHRSGTCLVRITGRQVGAGLRGTILRSVAEDRASDDARQVLAGRRPVVVLGLRTENRTAANLDAVCDAVLDMLPAGAALVVDGHNDIGRGEPPAVQVERAVAQRLRARGVARGVLVVDTIGTPVRTSLAWCAGADAFVGFWGAAFAKYRWVCNMQGLAVTSRWNLLHRPDLRIYDAPEFMEDATTLVFIDPAAVLDAAVPPEGPGFGNFAVEPAAWAAAVGNLAHGLDERVGEDRGRIARPGRLWKAPEKSGSEPP